MRIMVGVLLAIAMCVATAAIVPAATTGEPATQESKEFGVLRRQWSALRQRVDSLQAKADAELPDLVTWRKELDQAGRTAEKASTNRKRVGEYLKAHPDADYAYAQILSDWKGVATSDALGDPEKAKILKDVMAARFAEEKDKQHPINSDFARFAHFDDFWQAMRQSSESLRRRSLHDIERRKERNGLPDFVVTQARSDAYAKFDTDVLYGPAISLHTPPELKEAKKKLDELEAKMRTKFPQ